MSSPKHNPGRGVPSTATKIRCDVGGEWKAAEAFSKNKLRQLASGQRLAIACRVHSGEPETSLKCEGPCGKTYGLHSFSRNTRRNGVNWCKDCTDWAACSPSGIIPFPPPYVHRTEDEAAKVDTKLYEQDRASASVAAEDGGDGSSSPESSPGTPSTASTPDTDYADDEQWEPSVATWTYSLVPVAVEETAAQETSDEEPARGCAWAKPRMSKNVCAVPQYILTGRCQGMGEEDDLAFSDDGLSEDEI